MEELGRENGLDIIGYIPFDPLISQYDAIGRSLLELPEGAPSVSSAYEIFDRIREEVEEKYRKRGG